MADVEYGLAASIAECNYNMTEPATRYQPWVAEVVQQYTAFGNFAASSKLPPDVQQKVSWLLRMLLPDSSQHCVFNGGCVMLSWTTAPACGLACNTPCA